MSSSSTSWERVAPWYTKHLAGDDFLQREVIIPRTLDLLASRASNEPHLDIACGEGSFAQAFIKRFPKRTFVGIDASRTLIEQATHKRLPHARFFLDDARTLARTPNTLYGSASCILALQNIDQPERVFQAVAPLLLPNAPLVLVINHPFFRQPKQSSWGWDEARHIQYRRIDRYLTPYEAPIIAHPGKTTSASTPSFHWPLSMIMHIASDAGFVMTAMEEWTSSAESDSGPRARAENIARREIPLFLALSLTKPS